MRKLLITTRLILMSIVATANQQSSQLCLTLDENHAFSVSIDQSPFSLPGKVFTIDCIEPGYHFRNVVRSSFHSNNYTVLFRNYIYFPVSTKITASIDCNFGFIISELSPVLQDMHLHYHKPLLPCDNSFESICQVDFDLLKFSIASKNFDSSNYRLPNRR